MSYTRYFGRRSFFTSGSAMGWGVGVVLLVPAAVMLTFRGSLMKKEMSQKDFDELYAIERERLRKMEEERRAQNRENEQILLADLDKIERQYHRFRENSSRAVVTTEANASSS